MKMSNVRSFTSRDIRPLKGNFHHWPIITCDTETVNGVPYSIQFYDGVRPPELFYVNAETIQDCFYDYLERHMLHNVTVWFFYLPFDLPIIHYQKKHLFQFDSFQMDVGHFDLNVVSGKTWFVDGKYKDQCSFHIRDAFQFVFRGLAKICKDLGIDDGKMKAPKWLGERKPQTPEEKKYFEAYSKQDVVALWHVVQWIHKIHVRYDVNIAVSLADLCAKVFRKEYMQEKPIMIPSEDISRAALLSYHGGKTECYVKSPVFIRDIYEYDISSAYPYAMISIPNFFDYETTLLHNVPINRSLNPEGIYKITGNLNCKYRGLYDHSFKPCARFVNQWVTGYELLSCVKENEFIGRVEEGYIVESDKKEENPLCNYIWDFYKLKQKADKEKNATERLWNKLGLNSLYGKFIARVIEKGFDKDEHWQGGSLFNPLIATFITGFVRGYVHTIEHTLKAFHTSTDAFITKDANADKKFTGIEGLGSLKKEYQGNVIIFRRKLYIILDSNNKVLKAAMHGFYGSEEMLVRMWKEKRRYYAVKRMVRLKESMRSRDPEKIAFMMRINERTLNIDWKDYYVL